METGHLPDTLGALLRRHRRQAGLTQEELAAAADVSVRSLRDLERDLVHRPRRQSILRLAAALRLGDADRAELLAAPDARAGGGPGGAGPYVGVLGPLLLRRGAAALPLDSSMQRTLLGLLAVHPRQVVSRDEIVDVLWGERPPRTCRSLVHVYIGQLRAALEPGRDRRAPARTLALVRGGYRLDVDTDVARFAEFAERARRAHAAGDDATAEDLYRRALDGWRGPVLADATERLRHHPAAVALARARLAAALAHADLGLGLDRHAEVAARLRVLAPDEPLHEGLHARLMLALAGCGEPAAALRLFADLRARLADELGIEPGAEVQDAYLRVLRQAEQPAEPGPAASTAAAPALATATAPAQLPADIATFTGRERHIRQLDGVLSNAVVISAIAGTAGAGKTALAVHWGHRARARFPDGQLYVNLRGYAPGPPVRPIEALAYVLSALGVPPDRMPVDLDPAAALYRSLLADKRMLVVLDNAANADHVRPLLPGGRTCLALVTSRDQLTGLVARDGAQRVTLDVLSPAEAQALLARVLGADAVQAEPEAAAELAGLCAYLPLALRIAAANLLERPGRGSAGYVAGYVAALRAGNRLAALAAAGDEETALRATFELSYRGLPAEARRLFRLLGLVPGPDVTPEAAAALSGATVEQAEWLLDRLAGAHLIGEQQPGRYAFHDLLRLYATECVVQEEPAPARATATDRLFRWYLHRVDAAARVLYPEMLRLPDPATAVGAATAEGEATEDPTAAMAWLDAERANLIAAARHAADHGPREYGWLLADWLRGYFWLGGYPVDWLAIAHAGLAAAEAVADLRGQAAARLNLATAHHLRGGSRESVEHYTRALDLARRAGWTEGEAAALGNLGRSSWWTGRLTDAVDYFEQALALDQRTGRLAGQAASLGNLGLVYMELGRLAAAADRLAEALAIDHRQGNRNAEAVDHNMLGDALTRLGRLDEAFAHLERAREIHGEFGDRYNEADVLRLLALAHSAAGRDADAVELAERALAMSRDIDNQRIEVYARNALGAVDRRPERRAEAVAHHTRALRLARETDMRYPEAEALVGLARAHVRAGAYEEALARAGEALALTRQVGYRMLEGRTLAALADIHRALGHGDEAADHAERARAVLRETGYQRSAV